MPALSLHVDLAAHIFLAQSSIHAAGTCLLFASRIPSLASMPQCPCRATKSDWSTRCSRVPPLSFRTAICGGGTAVLSVAKQLFYSLSLALLFTQELQHGPYTETYGMKSGLIGRMCVAAVWCSNPLQKNGKARQGSRCSCAAPLRLCCLALLSCMLPSVSLSRPTALNHYEYCSLIYVTLFFFSLSHVSVGLNIGKEWNKCTTS